MTICSIIAAINAAHNQGEIVRIVDNALPVYSFDESATQEIKDAAQAAAYRFAHSEAKPKALIVEMEALCIHEPRGDHGLEGYGRGETYRCEMVEPAYPTPRYYRIYPAADHPEYYECATPRVFSKFFHVEEKAS